jgi:hypothetical protein
VPGEFRRAHGPYETPSGGWKLVLVRADGTRVTRTLETRGEADAVLEDLKLAATGARSIRVAVMDYLQVRRDEGLASQSVDRIEYHLASILDLERNGERPLTWLKGRGGELYETERARPNRSFDSHGNALNEA